MRIDSELLDMLTAQAKASPRLRMNYDLRTSVAAGSDCVAMAVEKGRWHRLECLESGTVILECKDDPFEPIAPEDILSVE